MKLLKYRKKYFVFIFISELPCSRKKYEFGFTFGQDPAYELIVKYFNIKIDFKK